jgi:hypothetical protein
LPETTAAQAIMKAHKKAFVAANKTALSQMISFIYDTENNVDARTVVLMRRILNEISPPDTPS